MLRARTTLRILWGALVASVLIPCALFGLFVWQSRLQALREAETTAERTVFTIQRHAQNVFDVFRITMDRVEDRIGSQDFAEIRTSRALHDFLAKLADDLPQISTIILTDADGFRISSSSEFEPASRLSLADRDYLRAFKAGHRGLFVGETVQGRRTGQLQIVIARSRAAADDGFKGAVIVSAQPGYFANFYRDVAPRMNYSAALLRADGTFVVRDATAQPSTEQPRASLNFMRAVQEGKREAIWTGVSAVDGVQRVTAVRKLDGDIPLYALFALGTDSILAHWREQVLRASLFAVPAIIGLVLLSGFALARTRREQRSAARLRAEMQRREQAEAKLAEAQKFEALGTLTAGIAHDFNNILQVVFGNLDMLRRAGDERRARLIDNAFRAAEQGRKITGQLLAFGRRQALRPEVTDVNALIAAMDDMLAQTLRSDIQLNFDLAGDLWPVELDRSQLQVALINLAANARDAMPKGGIVTVRTTNSVLDTMESVALSVIDTGAGMSAEILARLGEPFFSTKKETGHGNGLGLPQVYGFVHQSGGTVSVRSELGRGTTVTILLPRSTRAVAPATLGADEPSSRAPTPPLRVLLAEDNLQVAEAGAALLSNQGHDVVRAETAAQAIELLDQCGPFDLVISDLLMPGEMDGFGLATTIKGRSPELPVLLVTGYSEAASRAAEEGFALLAKPYSSADLAREISKLVSNTNEGRAAFLPSGA